LFVVIIAKLFELREVLKKVKKKNMQAAINAVAGVSSGDKFKTLSTPELMVDHATDETLSSPNLSLNLEICDLINAKGRSTPREVAFACSSAINTKPGQSGVLACALLDICAKNCGYPFHIILSTKEFLNDLVKRFPDRPVNIGPVQYHILDLIGSWNATLCSTSRHKNDFKVS
jgi:ADP-ribosylation factor-binding protein GGA